MKKDIVLPILLLLFCFLLSSCSQDKDLHMAILDNDIDTVKSLLRINRELVNDKESKLKWTPLHLASALGHEEIITLLIDNGADLNAKDEDGKTPLFYASSKGHKEIVEILINHGADVNAMDKNNNNVLFQTVFSGHYDVVNILIKNGADIKHKNKFDETLLHIISRSFKKKIY